MTFDITCDRRNSTPSRMRSVKRSVRLLHMTFKTGTMTSDRGWGVLFVCHRVAAGAFAVRTSSGRRYLNCGRRLLQRAAWVLGGRSTPPERPATSDEHSQLRRSPHSDSGPATSVVWGDPRGHSLLADSPRAAIAPAGRDRRLGAPPVPVEPRRLLCLCAREG